MVTTLISFKFFLNNICVAYLSLSVLHVLLIIHNKKKLSRVEFPFEIVTCRDALSLSIKQVIMVAMDSN